MVRPATEEGSVVSAADPASEREAKVEELRRAWLAGELDLSIDEDGPGMDRLLAEVLPELPPPPARGRRNR